MLGHWVDDDNLRDPLFVRVREVLMETWDPIGVSGEPNATNEYDSYIPRLLALLKKDASVEQMQDYLYAIVSERMGMSPPATRNDMKPAADALKQLGLS